MGNLLKERNKKNPIKIIGIVIATISLLSILFIIAVIKFTEPTAMNISLPETSKKLNNERLDKSNTKSITILLGENNKIIYYIGALGSPIISPKETKYGENGIRKELTLQNKSILENLSKHIKQKKLFVIIKPGTKSTYKNLVDILDEMVITNTENYAIVKDFTPEETKLLASK
jgi:biopolymer transport protein ExbD